MKMNRILRDRIEKLSSDNLKTQTTSYESNANFSQFPQILAKSESIIRCKGLSREGYLNSDFITVS